MGVLLLLELEVVEGVVWMLKAGGDLGMGARRGGGLGVGVDE